MTLEKLAEETDILRRILGLHVVTAPISKRMLLSAEPPDDFTAPTLLFGQRVRFTRTGRNDFEVNVVRGDSSASLLGIELEDLCPVNPPPPSPPPPPPSRLRFSAVGVGTASHATCF